MSTDETLRIKRLQAAELHGAMPETPQIKIDVKRVEHADGEGYTLILSVDHYWACHMAFRNDEGFTRVDVGYDQVRNYVDIEPAELVIVATLLQRASAIMAGGE
jgi:hypothetical protein